MNAEWPKSVVSTKPELETLLGLRSGQINHLVARLPNSYRHKAIPKPNGKIRHLYIPHGELKKIQADIKRIILDRAPLHQCVHGGVKGRSVISNARPHARKEAVLALDVKDCFPSITPALVVKVFERLSFQGEAVKVLALLTTFRFQLPQGAPTSPGLANLALRGIDVRMIGLARQQGFFYTRYVDDLAISGRWRLRKFLRLHQRIVQADGFRLKEKKSLMFQNEPQVITNLIVNRKVNLPKSKRAEIQKEAMEVMKTGQSKISESTLGKIAWARLINPPFGMRLLQRLRAVSK